MLGITVFSGMIGVTFFGLFLTPIFYVALRTLSERGREPQATALPPSSNSTSEPQHV